MELTDYIAAVREGQGDPAAMVGEFRRTTVLVPLLDGALCTAEQGGIPWIQTFTDEDQLALYAQARGGSMAGGAGAAHEEWEYAAVLGARLLDIFVPQSGRPTGIAIDVADSAGAMLLPPVRGIVPAEVAADGASADSGGSPAAAMGEGR